MSVRALTQGCRRVGGVLGAVGDLVEDVVVRFLEGEINIASDTEVIVQRRRGGSAANVVAAACAARRTARFIGQVGDDPVGTWLIADLVGAGAEVVARQRGRTGTVVVLVDQAGERTMLSDRGACVELDEPDPEWLDGLHTLHIPLYSLADEPLASTASMLARWAREQGLAVSIDASSAALIEHLGAPPVLDAMRALDPTVVLANELESAAFGGELAPERVGGALVVVKHGSRPARVLRAGHDPIEVEAVAVEGVRDTTGAGDAFAAGLLLALGDGADGVEATRAGHLLAAEVIGAASARAGG